MDISDIPAVFTTIRLVVEGNAKAQPRVRAFAQAGKARMYDPGTADDWKQKIAAEAYKNRPDKLVTGPVLVQMAIYLPRPKRLCRKKDPDHAIRHTVKPDGDNLEKAVLDALKGVIWADDKQIWACQWKKYYAAKGERPHIRVAIQFPTEDGEES